MLYRSYKRFNTSKYQKDLESVPCHVAEVCDSFETPIGPVLNS